MYVHSSICVCVFIFSLDGVSNLLLIEMLFIYQAICIHCAPAQAHDTHTLFLCRSSFSTPFASLIPGQAEIALSTSRADPAAALALAES